MIKEIVDKLDLMYNGQDYVTIKSYEWKIIRKALNKVDNTIDNNRFMTALKVCEEWRLDKKRGDMSFQSWCRERLNASKAKHFTKR